MSKVVDNIAEMFINQLENFDGTKSKSLWNKVSSAPVNIEGNPYSGINWLILTLTQIKNGYSPVWGTMKAWNSKGYFIKKGSKSTVVVYYTLIDDKNDSEKKIPIMKSYLVFNESQVEKDVDGEKIPYQVSESEFKNENVKVNEFFKNIDFDLREGTMAYYSPTEDFICMPPTTSFFDSNGYNAVLAHELVHWTSHKNRLDRTLSNQKQEYAFEELVAEIGSYMVCSRLNIDSGIRENHIPYIASWIKCLKEKPSAIINACSLAQKATDYLFKLHDERNKCHE